MLAPTFAAGLHLVFGKLPPTSRAPIDNRCRAARTSADVFRGGESRVLEADAADRFVAALHQGQLLTVADCSHNVHSQNTHGFLQAIDSFLATHSSD